MNEKRAPEQEPFLGQAIWRRWGMISLGCAVVLAIYAVSTELLRDSVMHFARLMTGSADMEPSHGWFTIVVFWGAMGFALLIALYCAILDMKFIRLEYLIAKRALVYQAFSTSDSEEKSSEPAPPSPKDTD